MFMDTGEVAGRLTVLTALLKGPSLVPSHHLNETPAPGDPVHSFINKKARTQRNEAISQDSKVEGRTCVQSLKTEPNSMLSSPL